jgi:hypothetical protein
MEFPIDNLSELFSRMLFSKPMEGDKIEMEYKGLVSCALAQIVTNNRREKIGNFIFDFLYC